MATAAKKPVQLPYGILTLMFGRWMLFAYAGWRLGRWVKGRVRILAHHPIIMAALLGTWLTRGWFPVAHLVVFAAIYIGLGLWMLYAPHSYRRHVDGRLRAGVWSRRYRRSLRERMTAVGIISSKDRSPLILGIHATPVITKVRLEMSWGMRLEDLRTQADRLAPAYKALDCKARPVRVQRVKGFMARPPFIQFKKKTVPNQVELEFLTTNPFDEIVPASYIDFYLEGSNPLPLTGNPAAMKRDGTPARHPIDRHLLLVGLTGRGKSNALRCHMYADRLAIYAGLLEVWGMDAKGGVEVNYMKHLFGRYCFGDGPNPERFYGEAFAAISDDAVRVMMNRLKQIRTLGEDVVWTPRKRAPALRLIYDEMLIFNADFIRPEVKSRIFSNISLIQWLGRAAKVTVYGCAQDPRKADLPNRGGFTDFRVFKVNDPIDVDLAMGRGAYERGARSPEIPFDQEGTCFEDNDEGGTPEEMRYPYVSNAEIKALPAVSEVLGFQSAFPQFAHPIFQEEYNMQGEPPRSRRYRSRKPRQSAEGDTIVIDPDEIQDPVTGEWVPVPAAALTSGPADDGAPRVRRLRDRAKARVG